MHLTNSEAASYGITAKPAKRKRQHTKAIESLVNLFARYGFHGPDLEYKFHPERRWKFDIAFRMTSLSIEYEGGCWSNGRHQRPVGFQDDCFKYDMAALLGWTVLRITEPMIRDGRADALASIAADTLL